MKIAQWGLVILLLSPLGSAAARQPQQAPPPDQSASAGQSATAGQQQESLGDAARRAQEQKKNQPKAAKVWDNDTIPAVPGNVNVVGQSGESAGAPPSAAPEAGQKPSGPATPEQKAALESDLNAAKANLESLKTDLDIAQRKYTLDEQSYLSNPNHSEDKAGAAALQDEKDQIAAKQQEIADAQKKIDDLQAQVNAANSGNSQ
jgi:hypothetical protein